MTLLHTIGLSSVMLERFIRSTILHNSRVCGTMDNPGRAGPGGRGRRWLSGGWPGRRSTRLWHIEKRLRPCRLNVFIHNLQLEQQMSVGHWLGQGWMCLERFPMLRRGLICV